jgi:hypothetical protein
MVPDVQASPNADSGRVIRVIGYATVDEFYWFCHKCSEYSEPQPDPTIAYGLAEGHARWHGWDRDDIITLGWPERPLPPVGRSEP